jgi:simple sugar transport system ATP-binding protein
MTVAENIFVGDLPMKKSFGFMTVDTEAMRHRSSELLGELGFASIDPTTVMKRLSVAEQRIVEIARALAGQARILIMDEPTAALGVPEQRKVISLIHQLKAQGRGVIFISHNLQDIFAVSDRIVVLRRGVKAGERKISETTHDEVVKLMVGG